MYLMFRDLTPGQKFRFAYGLNHDRLSTEVHTKEKGVWYRREQDGRRYTTGAKTAVKREAGE